MVTVIVIIILDVECIPRGLNMWGLLGENAANIPS